MGMGMLGTEMGNSPNGNGNHSYVCIQLQLHKIVGPNMSGGSTLLLQCHTMHTCLPIHAGNLQSTSES